MNTDADHFGNSITAADTAAIKLVNSTTCMNGRSISACALASDSPGHNTSTTGNDIGVNITTWRAAMSPSDLGGIRVCTWAFGCITQ